MEKLAWASRETSAGLGWPMSRPVVSFYEHLYVSEYGIDDEALFADDLFESESLSVLTAGILAL
jgi:hypothetical protein